MQRLVTSTTQVSQENNFNGHAYNTMYSLPYGKLSFLMEYCTDRWLGRQMEATEEKKDRQTEGQTTKLRQIQQDTKADQ